MFPPELVDLLLDFVHSDSTTLSACTLVCRYWLPSARFHLLSQLALDSASVESFLDDLDDIDTGSLGNVTSLRIEGLDLSTAPVALPHAFPNLQSLCLEAFEANSFFVIATWISGIPSLRSLKLSGDWDGDDIVTLPMLATVPKLSHLDLNCPLRVILGWFLTLEVVPVASSLVLRDIWGEESPAISRYLAATGASLDSLVLVYPRKEVLPLDLTHNVNVRSLSFECYAHAMPRIVCETLVGSGRENLETLHMNVLGVPPGFPTETDISEWHRVNTTISALQFPRLRSIQLQGLQYGGTRVTQLLPIQIGAAIVASRDL
ncbi:hypothetical protein B0H17DRAFT_299047 [Mycena rosella]|uniref:F-box domain-containing protein n=1 Tax=Mycena rosella TaxID=1033263 RepID=A0AAD7CUH9_MYCRO|nr:hypothetical protein B0H17DRAFT_299047 [Mycena rosella]